MSISVDDLIGDIGNVMNDILTKDVKLLRGYSETKAKSIARYTKLIAESYAAGEIDEAELQEELDELNLMIERFVRNLKALTNTTVERLIAGVTNVLYGAIRMAATGAGVPLPALDLGEG